MASSATVGLLRVLLTANTAEFEAAMKKASDSAKVWSKDFNQIGRQAEQIGASMTKFVTVPIVAAFAASAKAAIDFESSFAGVRKTVNATEPEFAKLAQGFRDLAKTIPVNVNELNKIGEAAGQLGIKKENIIGFSAVMAKLGVTTNLSSDQAATSLARLANITQMPQSNFDRLGSTIVALGNNFATTESEITEFGLRIAGAGKIAGLSEHQILSIGAAMSSVGVEAEAGGTAVQKVLNAMTESVATGNKHLAAFAETAQMSAADFQKAFKQDAAGAFTAFVNGLKTEGDKAFVTLDNLGLGNERVIRAFLSLANAGDLLNNTLKIGADAWRENTALTKEAEERFKTTQSQLTLLWNKVTDLGITIGNALPPAIQTAVDVMGAMLPIAEGLAHAFAALPGPVQLAVVGFAGVVAALGPMIWLSGQLITSLGALTGAFAAKGIATRALTAALGTTTVAAAGTTAGVGAMASALALLTNPITLAIAGLGALGVAVYAIATAETEMEKAFRRSSTEFTKQMNALDSALKSYDSLRNKQALTKDESKKLDDAKRALAQASGLTKEAFEKEEGASNKLTDALRDQLAAQKELRTEMVNRARSEAADALQAVEDAKAQLNRVVSGKATTGANVKGEVFVRPLNTHERIQEVERLNAVIAELQKKADAAHASYRDLTGQAPRDIHLAIDATQQAGTATKALGDKLDGLKGKLKDADNTIDGLAASVRQKLTEAIKSGAFSMDELKQATGLSEFVIKRFEDRLNGAAKATKAAAKEAGEAEKAAEAHANAVAKQADALEKLGIVTENQVLKELAELNELIQHATAAGVPLDRVLMAIAPRLEELRRKADASGVSMEIFGESLNAATRAAQGTLQAIINSVPPAVTGLSQLPGIISQIPSAADVAAQNTANSLQFFGLKTRAELEATARAAVAHYEAIKASGEATPEAIQQAFERMNDALRAVGQELQVTYTSIFAEIARQAAASFSMDGARGLANFGKQVLTDFTAEMLSFIPGVGPILKEFAKPLIDWATGLFRDTQHEQVNDQRDEFLAQFGPSGTGPNSGFSKLAAQLHTLGPAGDALFHRLLNAKKVEDFQRAMEDVNKALANTPEALAAAAGFKTREDLQETADKAMKVYEFMRDSGRYSAEQVAEAWERAKQAQIAAMDDAQRAAVDANQKVVDGLKKQLDDLNAEYDQLFAAVSNEAPEEVMGVVEQAQRARMEAIKVEREEVQKQLDEANKALELSMKGVEDAMRELARVLREEVGGALDDLDGRKIRIGIEYDAGDIPVPSGGVPSPASTGGLVTKWGIKPMPFTSGGKVPFIDWSPIGADSVPALLKPQEIVMNEGQTGHVADALRSAMELLRMGAVTTTHHMPSFAMPDLSSGMFSRPIQAVSILQVDKREFGRAMADVLPGELRRLGVRVRA